MTKAHEILTKAAQHMQDRAATYDKPDGERSIDATIAAFKAITGDGLMNTEERGWLFMSLLKKVRSQQGEYKADNYEDDTAYSALQGEAAARERGAVSFDWLNHTHSRTPANWTEEDEARQSVIMQNGNDGLHYEYRVFINKLNERTLNAATPHNFAK